MRRLFAVLLLLLATCATLPTSIDSARDQGAEPIIPPDVYARWYEEAEVCTGSAGAFHDVRWWKVPGRSWEDPYWGRVIGLQGGDDILIAGYWLMDRESVIHEIMHHLGYDHRGYDAPPYPWPFEGC
jgi:hypothetical protein